MEATCRAIFIASDVNTRPRVSGGRARNKAEDLVPSFFFLPSEKMVDA